MAAGWKKIQNPIVIGITPKEFYDRYWSHKAIKSYKDFQLSIGNWDVTQSRDQVNFTMALEDVPFCSQTRVIQDITRVKKSKDMLILEVKSKTIEAPYSDSFFNYQTWVVLSDGMGGSIFV